jgi:hypothetical protein
VYLVFKVQFRESILKVPFQPSTCQYPTLAFSLKSLLGKGFSDGVNRFLA